MTDTVPSLARKETGEQVQVHANVPGGRGNMAPLIPGNPLPQPDASPQDLSGQPPPPPRYMDNFCTLMHGVQSAGSRETRLNMTAEGMESDAHALEHARAVPDPLRDAASDEEGCRHGHFGQAVAPEGDFGAPPELFGELDNSALSDTDENLLGVQGDPSGENLLEDAPRFAELFADEVELFGEDDVAMDPPPVPPLFDGQWYTDERPQSPGGCVYGLDWLMAIQGIPRNRVPTPIHQVEAYDCTGARIDNDGIQQDEHS